MGLFELLKQRTTKELFVLVGKIGLSHPGGLSDSDAQKLWRVYNASRGLNEEYYLSFYRDFSEKNQEEIRQKKRGRPSDSEFILEQFCQENLEIGRLLLDVRSRHDDYAKCIADHLLCPDVFIRFYRSLPEAVASALIAVRDNVLLSGENGIYPLSVALDERKGFLDAEASGYLALIKIPPEESGDERQHITGMMLSDDVVSLLRLFVTDALEAERKRTVLLVRLTYLASAYYDICPVSLIRQLYAVYIEKKPDGYPELTTEDVSTELLRIREEQESCFTLFSYQGKEYFSGSIGFGFDEENPSEDDYEVLIIKSAESEGNGYYIPEYEDIEDYFQWGYCHAQKPFRELFQFYREFYLDEKLMADMGNSMWRIAGLEEMTRTTSLDWVDDEAEKNFFEALMYFSTGEGPKMVRKEHEFILLALNDRARRKYNMLLRQCFLLTHQPQYLGHTEFEIKNKNE